MRADDCPTADANLRAEPLAALPSTTRCVLPSADGGLPETAIDTDDPRYVRWCQIDGDNTAWLRGILAATGWPTIDRVGDDGAQAAWPSTPTRTPRSNADVCSS